MSHFHRQLQALCCLRCQLRYNESTKSDIIYNENSTFDKPTLPFSIERRPPLAVISITRISPLLPGKPSKHSAKVCYRRCCDSKIARVQRYGFKPAVAFK